jgi:hypothetical protein
VKLVQENIGSEYFFDLSVEFLSGRDDQVFYLYLKIISIMIIIQSSHVFVYQPSLEYTSIEHNKLQNIKELHH